MAESRANASSPPLGRAAAPCERERDVLQALRDATAAAHQQLEADSPLLQPHATQATYFAYLRAISPLVEVAEAMLLPLAPVVAGDAYPLRDACRHPSLLADLTHALPELRVARVAPAQRAAKRAAYARALAPHENFGGRFGILYVLEGSTLGGRVLCRELSRRLALVGDQLGYLAGHGPRTGARWKQTRALLEKHLRTPAQRAQAGAAAKAMFLSFGHAVSEV